ncbi:DNA-binding transcriptional LysR family regulator [Microbacterium sp. SORGH_AS 888]|nr:LysR family transcriptional regulator [Microbacterium sp. SORGH_AS_0888]MDQ1130532.1 DNA-binding transcriptional LysR family regulator [Microbacterium sp. SORGH_AS_0888]
MAETLDIIQLRTFVAIDECGGFGRAAAALHMSQPTVSQHVRSLERRLQQRLVERDGRRARFTLAGEKLLAEARRILAVHDEALARLDVSRSSTIVVGSTETAAEQVLPEMLDRLHSAYPDTHVQFTIDRSTQMVEAVAKGTIDLAVVLDTGQTVAGTEVGSLPLNWYSSPGWTPPADDAPVALVAYVEPCGMRQRALQELNVRGRRVEIAAESGSLEGVIAAARAGLGVAVLPSAGKAPAGLVARHDLPPLGRIFVRLIARRGLDAEIENAALAALDGFFTVRGYVHAVSA